MGLHLFEEAFPGLNANIARCEKLGFPWASRPYVLEVAGEVVSHVGLLDYPVHAGGKKYAIGALHAICTKASHRGHGYASELIQKALTWAQEHYECLLLFTDIPQFYERLSFRLIQEHRFCLPLSHPKGSKALLPICSPQDDRLFIRTFRERAVVSDHFWVQDNGQIASFNSLFATYPTYWSLYYCSAFDGLLSFEIKDNTLHLYDIVAKTIPSLDTILDHLPSPIEEIYFYFSPDLLCASSVCDSTTTDFNGCLMVHGTFPVDYSFMIPPLSRC
ncbi:MAG: GNAT family N-acetyltransferase [Verrucomicrobia bacterium]|nr:GNAT family N-acetyltransferase [Verrucomicrobiota bacterium]